MVSDALRPLICPLIATMAETAKSQRKLRPAMDSTLWSDPSVSPAAQGEVAVEKTMQAV